MTTSLFSTRWHRVAHLQPLLRPHVQLRPQSQRGTGWYLLIDPTTDDVRRLNRLAYEFVGRFDGVNTVDGIWQALLREHPEEAMSQDEVLRLLIQLHERHLIQFDARVDVEALFALRRQERRQRRKRRVNPLAFQMVLGNPERLLDRLAPLGHWMYSLPGMAVWLLLVVSGLLVALLHLPALVAHSSELLSSSRWMLMAWVLYPFIKLVHEMAHGLAVHRWGGRVREAGFFLLVLVPVPFVNASAADSFRFRYQRAVVSAAGIMTELALAAAAVLVWQWLQPSLLRDLALLAIVTGLLSTLLVNANPLMRFDGYFLLCDLLDLRNLAQRSNRWWVDFAQRRVLGVEPRLPLDVLPGERAWLVAYAPLALIYRFVLSVAILFWLGGQSVLLAVLLGLYLAWVLLMGPLWRLLRGTTRSVAAQPKKLAPALRAMVAGGLVLFGLFVLPVPFGTVAQGVVWMPERAHLRAGTDGFVDQVLVSDGQRVNAGDPLMLLRNERLDAEARRLEADHAELETQLFHAMANNPLEVPKYREQSLYLQAALQRLAQQQEALTVRAQVAGEVIWPRALEAEGQFHKQGDLLGYVRTDDPLLVRVALPQDQAQLVRERGGAIGVRLAQDGYSDEHAAKLQRDLEAAITQLPSRALGDQGGGDLVTVADDPQGVTVREPVVLMDLELPQLRGIWVGSRVAVRFDHGRLDLMSQLVRRLRQLVLQRFDVLGV